MIAHEIMGPINLVKIDFDTILKSFKLTNWTCKI